MAQASSLLETPSNPQPRTVRHRGAGSGFHRGGVHVVVDNTTATAYLQQPLALGADYVVAADTKALTGHSDVVLGHVATADNELPALRTWRTQHGAIRTDEVWLAHRSLATLPLRLDAATAALARFLGSRPAVQAVYFPGLPNHPGHAIARRQMRGWDIVSFDLGTRQGGSISPRR